MLTKLVFGQARRNFYEAARRGLDAELLWPADRGASPVVVSALELAERLLPVAERGLALAGVDATEASSHLGTIGDRLAARTTGARWQRRALTAARARFGEGGEAAMLARYAELSEEGAPVHLWPE